MRKRKKTGLILLIAGIAALASAAGLALYLLLTPGEDSTNDTARYVDAFSSYMARLKAEEYDALYAYLDAPSKAAITKEAHLARNKNIYAGIDANNISVEVLEVSEPVLEKDAQAAGARDIRYRMRMDTLAGPLDFTHTARVYAYRGEEAQAAQFLIAWNSAMIFPDLGDADKVSVNTVKGARGSIFDRNGELLAGEGIVCAVGFVPGKMSEDAEQDIFNASIILEMNTETIKNKLNASWVKPELFVPLKYIRKDDEEKKALLLAIPGILITDEKARVYPLGASAAHLTGYIQNITKEELDARPNKRYNASSKLGKVGLESLLEDRIRGIDGCKIAIVSPSGTVKSTLASVAAVNGEDVHLTIDARVQQRLYEQMKADKGAAIVMNPRNGEVLALMSTPAYDPNEFILGISDALWGEWSTSEMRPLYNRFKATVCPGSSFKPIIAATGLTAGSFSKNDDFGASGRSWQRSSAWGGYTVTTLKEYGGGANTRNALIYSDNIYFAKAALKIGGDALAKELGVLGFNEAMPFAFGLSPSSFGEDASFRSEIELADSGYGQGRILVNPVHMASMYSAFVNEGDMVLPQLEMGKGTAYFKTGVFSKEAVQTVQSALLAAVENPNGTGHEAMIPGRSIAGKTGTAEIKLSKDDEEGTEIGWFIAFSADGGSSDGLLVLAMIEDVKGRHGSHYVIPKVRSVFDASLSPTW